MLIRIARIALCSFKKRSFRTHPADQPVLSTASMPAQRSLPFAIALGLLLAAAASAPAHAQRTKVPAPLPTATLLDTSGASAHEADQIDAAVHAALERLGLVTIALRPGLDLGAAELATGCVGETVRCLRALASQSGVELVLAPSLERRDQEIVLTLLYFDARAGGELRRAARSQDRPDLGPELMAAIPNMLRELFRLPDAARAGSDDDATATRPRPFPTGAVLLSATGVLVLGGGVVTGLMAQSTQRAYERQAIESPADVDAAIHKRSLAKTEALIANVLYATGAGTLAFGAIWLAIALSQPKGELEPQHAVLPLIGPGQLGVTLVYHGRAL
jgi:hypothetical protein